MNKNLAFVNSSSSWGGLEINVVRLAKWLSSANYKATIICIKNTAIDKAAKTNNLDIEYIEKHKKYYDFCKAKKLHKIIISKNISSIFIFDNRDLSLCAITKLLSKNKIKLIFQQNMLIGGNKKDIFHRIRFSFIDKWISPLYILKNQVLKYTNIPEKKIEVIPLCIDIDEILDKKNSKIEARNKLNINQETTLLGIIGRIDKLKGQDFLIEAINKLRSENYNIELLISGDPTNEIEGIEYNKYIIELVKKYKLENYVHFRPFTKNISELYSAIDIFALASKNETYGMVTIEAMCFAKAIIATDSGGTPEILKNGEFGLLYKPNNLNDFLEKIKLLLNNKNLQDKFAEKAKQEAVTNYSHKKEIKEITNILENL